MSENQQPDLDELDSIGLGPACPDCGYATDWLRCWNCFGEGGFDGYDEDPFWYDEGDIIPCNECHSKGGWWRCWNCKKCFDNLFKAEPKQSLPKRISLKRLKNWRMPPNTLKIDRSTRWGNPFAVGQKFRNLALYICLVGQMTQPEIDQWYANGGLDIPTPQVAVEWFERYARWRINEAHDKHWLDPLRGKNLGCWCREDAVYCHGDVLLRLAN
jgi:hypothetical protein